MKAYSGNMKLIARVSVGILQAFIERLALDGYQSFPAATNINNLPTTKAKPLHPDGKSIKKQDNYRTLIGRGNTSEPLLTVMPSPFNFS